MIDQYLVKSGLLRFNFMLDCCTPGSVPDPHLVAGLLDLVRSGETSMHEEDQGPGSRKILILEMGLCSILKIPWQPLSFLHTKVSFELTNF